MPILRLAGKASTRRRPVNSALGSTVAKSPAFARIKSQILELVSSIPQGRFTTYQSIGSHLDVMPRHVAYILSQLEPAAKMVYPWHRVVSGDGSLGVTKTNPDGSTQSETLLQEGFAIELGKLSAECFKSKFIEAVNLNNAVPKQTRPPQLHQGKPPRSQGPSSAA